MKSVDAQIAKLFAIVQLDQEIGEVLGLAAGAVRYARRRMGLLSTSPLLLPAPPCRRRGVRVQNRGRVADADGPMWFASAESVRVGQRGLAVRLCCGFGTPYSAPCVPPADVSEVLQHESYAGGVSPHTPQNFACAR